MGKDLNENVFSTTKFFWYYCIFNITQYTPMYVPFEMQEIYNFTISISRILYFCQNSIIKERLSTDPLQWPLVWTERDPASNHGLAMHRFI